ncbi:MAG: hypothetical protein DCC69_07285 [Hyphomicrobiales bacterium]|nr:MAG: hypothetical protein DCC69_07285 [Hyphomicrobiales bacterium]
MAEVTNELIFEVLKNLQQRTANVESVGLEHSQAMNAMRGHLMSIQTDTNNIYGILSRIDQRLDRIEKRLELRELAEPQRPYRPE